MAGDRYIVDTNVLFSGLYSAQGDSYRILELVEQERVKVLKPGDFLKEIE